MSTLSVRTRYVILGFICGGIIFSSLSGFLVWTGYFVAKTHTHSQYTNQTLDYFEVQESLSRSDQIKLESDLKTMISQAESEGILTTASIYFRDLNNGPWIGINSTYQFSPASLLKVPLAMAVFAEKQENPDILSEEIEYLGPKGISIEHYPGDVGIEVGKIYSVRELIELMLQQSDNDATVVLSQYLGAEKVQDVYDELGVTRVEDYLKYSINVRSYSYFFRALFNAYFFDRNSSEDLLGIMTKVSFTDGLVAGVPKGTVVSHKFGERIIDETKPLVQLHDCGIVYSEPNPYILCVMTQGSQYDKLASFIGDVSKKVFDAIESQ